MAIEKFQKDAEETNLMTSKMGRSEGGKGDGDQGERHCPGDWGMAVRTPVVSDTGPLLSACAMAGSRRRVLQPCPRDLNEDCSSPAPESQTSVRATLLPPADTTSSTSFFLDHLTPYESSFRSLLGLLPTRPSLHRVAMVKCV